MMIASPNARKGYVSHRNSSFPGLLKTIFGILRIPPLKRLHYVCSVMAPSVNL